MIRAPAPPTGLACSGCGYDVPAAAGPLLSCPQAAAGDDVDHLVSRVFTVPPTSLPVDTAAANPFLRWRTRSHGYHRARALGWSDADYVRLVEELDAAVARVDGRGFRITPFRRSEGLSQALGLSPAGGAWVKDETGNVSGSHKARHLVGTMLELLVPADATDGEAGPPSGAPLAIASCGNAALAAAVVARAASRSLLVFIPADADPEVVRRLRSLGAECQVCGRDPGAPGDPTYAALLRAMADGAIPFTCQGNLNGLAIPGGETLGWELASAVGTPEGPPRLDRAVIQVGGGALMSSVAAGLRADGCERTRLHAVQPAAVHPLARAFERVRARVVAGEALDGVLADAARHRGDFMWPWEREPRSLAHGIIDDETYDWRACVQAMIATGGGPLVVSEASLRAANDLAREATGIDVDPTGSAGLAGLMDLARIRALAPAEHIAVIFSGAVRRPPDRDAAGRTVPTTHAETRHDHHATSGVS